MFSVFQTLRNLASSRLKKIRFGSRSELSSLGESDNVAATTSLNQRNADQFEDVQKSPVCDRTALNFATPLCTASPHREHFRCDDDTTSDRQSVVENVDDTDNCNENRTVDDERLPPGSTTGSGVTCSALSKSNVDDNNTATVVVVPAKPVPTRVSVAVQTDAYDSEDSSDDDSSSSGSWESCSRSGNESSDDEDIVPPTVDKMSTVGRDIERQDEAENDSAKPVINEIIDLDTDNSGIVTNNDGRLEEDVPEDCHESDVMKIDDSANDVVHSDTNAAVSCEKDNSSTEPRSDSRPVVDVTDSPESVESVSDSDSEEDQQVTSLPVFTDHSETCGNEPSRVSYSGRLEGDSLSANESINSPPLQRQRRGAAAVCAVDTMQDSSDMMPADDVLMFKTPEQSPVDNRYGPASLTYQPGSVVSGSYGSSPLMYSALDGSPSCAIATSNSACLTVNGGNAIGYCLPTPSPTNSSSRSFSMASPSAGYQQLPPVNGTPVGFQSDQQLSTPGSVYGQELARYQPSVTPVAGHNQRAMASGAYSPSAYHYGYVPSPSSMEWPIRSCPSAPTFGYSVVPQVPQMYQKGSGVIEGSFPTHNSWQHFGQQQQQQVQQMPNHRQNTAGFYPQHVIPADAVQQRTIGQSHQLGPMSMAAAAAGCRPLVQHHTDSKSMNRRCGKSYTKNGSASSSLLQQHNNGSCVADVAAPNVTLQPGTNVITGYNAMGYDSNFTAGGYRKSSGQSGNPSLSFPESEGRHNDAFSYRNGYPSERYQVCSRSDREDSYVHQQQRMVTDVSYEPVRDSRMHGLMYPTMASSAYANGPMPNSRQSYGMR